MSASAQRSFAAGEIAPALYGRVDQVKYATGLRKCRNFLVMRHGGVSNRPGTKFVAEVKNSAQTVRLLPFVFNADQTYVLEFGDQYMRVHRNGTQSLLTGTAITLLTPGNPVTIVSPGHGLANGDEVFLSGIGGTTELNGRNFKVVFVSISTFTLRYMDNVTAVNGTGFGAWTSGGTVQKVYEIATPYVEADLQTLQIVQSADVITIVHPNYAPRELARTGHTSWTLTALTFDPSIARPRNLVGTRGAVGTNAYRYIVTAVKRDSGEESLPALHAAEPISNITQANPAVLTHAGAFSMFLANGDEIFLEGVVGMTQVNGRTFNIANLAALTLELKDTNSTAYGAYVASATDFFYPTFVRIIAAAVPTVAAPNLLVWDAVVDAVEYNVYKEVNGVFGFLGVAQNTTFSDDGQTTPDEADQPPLTTNYFKVAGDFPSAVTYFQQRLCLANSDNDPERFWGSRTGQFKNFTRHSPLQDDDRVDFTMVGRQVNEIRHMVDIGNLIILTTGGEWTPEGDAAGILTPLDVNLKQRSYRGASELAPLVIGGNALYVQARGSIVRDLLFDFAVDNYRGNDLTIFSAHLVDGFALRDWAYQQVPHSIVWLVREDGRLLGLTYVKEQEVNGWHQHDFGGTVEQVCSVPEGAEDGLYLVIKRTLPGLAALGGSTRRYVERFASRQVDAEAIEDSIFVESSLSFDGRNTNTAHTMTLSGGTTWASTETLTLTSSASFFTSADVGNAIHLTGADGTLIRFTIEGFTSGTVVTGRSHATVPVGMRNIAISTWTRAVDQVGQLWHLEGKNISVFADGFVAANPNNAAYQTVTVTNGIATLDKPYGVVHAGLPYTSDLETLDLDVPSGESLADKKKLLQRVTLFVEAARGVFVGPALPTTDASQTGMNELKVRNAETYNEPVRLITGTVDVNIRPTWEAAGRVAVRQTDPLPLAVLAVVPSGYVPYR